MTDWHTVAERWQWQPSEINGLDFEDLCMHADFARELAQEEKKIRSQNTPPPSSDGKRKKKISL